MVVNSGAHSLMAWLKLNRGPNLLAGGAGVAAVLQPQFKDNL